MPATSIPISDRPLTERAFIAMSRRALDGGRYPIVRLDEDLEALDGATGSRRRSHDSLRRLQRDGRLRRIRRGIYVLVGPTGTADTGVFQLIDATTPRPYLITAGRALAEFGLSDQHFFRVVILTPHDLESWRWQGDDVVYVHTPEERIWGLYTPNGPSVALPERAILDCLAHPRWGVTLPQVAEAIDRGIQNGRTPPAGLASAATRYRNHAAAQRLGYLIEALHGADAAEPFLALRGRTHSAVLLSASGMNRGPIDSKWRVRVNVDPDALVAHRIIG
jgi:predicted transcriptional regulator of viral defense system